MHGNRNKLFGLSEQETTEVWILNGKWIAIVIDPAKNNEPKILRKDGRIMAEENPIEVQDEAQKQYPNLYENKNIVFRLIPNNLYLTATPH